MWAVVKMSMHRKLSSLNGRLSLSFRLGKQDHSLHVDNTVKTWRRKFLLLCLLLGAFAIGSISFLLSFDNRELAKKDKNQDAREEIAEFTNKLEFQHLGGWFTSIVDPDDQCPVGDAGNLRRLEQPVKSESISSAASSDLSFISQVYEKDDLQKRGAGDCMISHNKTLFSGGLRWGLFIVLITSSTLYLFSFKIWMNQKESLVRLAPMPQPRQQLLQLKQQSLPVGPSKGAGKWRKKLLKLFVLGGILSAAWLFQYLSRQSFLTRQETLVNMCDERARMLQDQFNVSMNHVHALAILVSTFHHGKDPSKIDQKTFGEYTETTAFERPLTSGVAYALKVPHSDRKLFEKQHRWTIKKMETQDQTLVQDCIPEKLDPAPISDEYAPVIFSQETVSHIVSIDMMSGKEDRDNILRARASGKGVLTSPFKLLKSNHLGVVLTFAVYNTELPLDATPEQRIEAAVGYLGASYDVPSLVEKLLHQLASKETIFVHVYDTTNSSSPILMYGSDVIDTGLLHVSNLDFGDPLRRHEMHCRFKHKPPLPWAAINSALGVIAIVLLVGHIFNAAIIKIDKVEEDYHQMMELKVRAEAADVAKSQFLATVSHEIRTPMNGVLGMLQMLMNTNLDANQKDYTKIAHDSGKDLISLINGVLDQAKIESGRLELEAVPFHLYSLLDSVISSFSSKSYDKQIELAVYVSKQVPEVVVGDPGRFRQIIANLVGNSIKFTDANGHIFVSVHLFDEVRNPLGGRDSVLEQGPNVDQYIPCSINNTLSGFPVVNRWKSWENFGKSNMLEAEMIRLLVTIEDTGMGIKPDAQSRIFTPFMQVDSSTSRNYGGTGIGLSVSKRLVNLMGGEIGFVSEPGTGSTFSFTVTLSKGEPSSLDTKLTLYGPPVSEYQGWWALVIDERAVRVEVTRYHLRRLGINVRKASSMKLACSCLPDGCVSLPALSMVLIDKDDWNKENGVTFRHFLNGLAQNGGSELPTGPPKIFLLATTITPGECIELISAGLVDDVLIKPLRLSVLIACFQEAFGSGNSNQVCSGKASSGKLSTLQKLLNGKQILVVDDNMVNRRVAEGSLKIYGAIVTCVESGKAAIEMLKPPHRFDACFMDRQMPEMDGFEATRQIRNLEIQFNEQIAYKETSTKAFGNEAFWHTPILAMTADVIQATNEECMKCGMDGCVSKPLDEDQLYDAVAPFFKAG
ncbi:hypothetical protein K2173_018460 [Erythroxylum novogranatense]|uniref:histidine kinase n=1 Tax=Erythroxylum novogranatense TaxID=1862640 RepID=A0AAV8UF78_9ROSI|nr:hypothetical protein K2173_018460 [Erythroxylum novogranatense]